MVLIQHRNPANPKQVVGASATAVVTWPNGGRSWGEGRDDIPAKLRKNEVITHADGTQSTSKKPVAKKAPVKKAAAKKKATARK